MKIQTENPVLYRDVSNRAIIIKDNYARELYRQEQKLKQMEKDIADIREMLTILINRKKED